VVAWDRHHGDSGRVEPQQRIEDQPICFRRNCALIVDISGDQQGVHALIGRDADYFVERACELVLT
jgi:hypothetical protein